MDTEKIVINLPENCSDVVIREGQAQNILDVKAPIRIELSGTIGAPYEFLLRRINTEQFPIEKCNITVLREDVAIRLVINEDDFYNYGNVYGQLSQHPKFLEFGINTSRRWQPNEFGQFCKMNRAYFPDKEANMRLVALLKNYLANISTQYEKERSDNGSFKDNYSGLVSHNLPPTFNLKIPVFKGTPANELEVEFYAVIDGKDVYLQLCSPSANQIFEEVRDSVLDEQIALIRAIAPNIVIIEK